MFIENICNPLNEANGPTKCPIACIDIGQAVNLSDCHEYWLDRRVQLNEADFDTDHLKRLQVFGAVMGTGTQIKSGTTVVFLYYLKNHPSKAVLNTLAIMLPFCLKRFGFKGYEDEDYNKFSGWQIVGAIWNEQRMPNDDFMYKWVFSCFPSALFRLYSILEFALIFLWPFIDSITGEITSV